MIIAADSFTVVLHRGFYSVVVLYFAILALWGLILFFRRRNPSGGYLGALVLAEGVVVLEALIGIVLLLQGHRPNDMLHYVYGLVAVIALPAAYFLSANGTERRDSLYFAIATAFTAAIALRAGFTGAGHF